MYVCALGFITLIRLFFGYIMRAANESTRFDEDGSTTIYIYIYMCVCVCVCVCVFVAKAIPLLIPWSDISLDNTNDLLSAHVI